MWCSDKWYSVLLSVYILKNSDHILTNPYIWHYLSNEEICCKIYGPVRRNFANNVFPNITQVFH